MNSMNISQKNTPPQSIVATHLKILQLSLDNFLNAKNEKQRVNALDELISTHDSIKDSSATEQQYASCNI